MISIVILGLGFIMVATLFPVAWTRARALSEHTTQRSTTTAAQTTMTALLRAAGGTPESLSPMLCGDLIIKTKTNPPEIIGLSDTRVHALNMENIQLPTPGGATTTWQFVPADQDQPQNPFRLERTCAAEDSDYWLQYQDDAVVERSFGTPRVSFAQRVHPPLPARQNVAADGTFTPGSDAVWDKLALDRGYAWAVLHRLRKPVGPSTAFAVDAAGNVSEVQLVNRADCPPLSTATAEEQAAALRTLQAAQAYNETRALDMYYVTLRRPQATHRYAVQDPEHAPDPLLLSDPPVAPQALGAEFDCLLPVPWRVQVYFPGEPDDVTDPDKETGIPSEIWINTTECRTSPVLVSMFERGAYFIDEINGTLFQVTRLVPSPDGQEAVATLDREVVPRSLFLTGYPPCEQPEMLQDEERIRTVWVFPPPVDAGHTATDLTFVGPQPVVGIEVGTLNLLP
ncbi:MAG TPA: hypothetical protein PKK06_03570 [Phycisphaerae bacterium]|nr:hypothetical protein [Phycisphaerae bacterium]HNU45358.1 hypothetical protein [Phycisphaerae bacterium]